MRFLADMGVDLRVVESLRRHGHDVVHLRPTGYGTRRNPFRFYCNVRLSFTAMNLIIRERVGEHFTDNRSNPENRPKCVQLWT